LQALVRPPSPTFAQGLTSQCLGAPDYGMALRQHEAYCEALQKMGAAVRVLAPDNLPDSCFVEDMAIILGPDRVVVTRSQVRGKEQRSVLEALPDCMVRIPIEGPGSLEGGDVLRLAGGWFVGLGARSNRAGFEQFREIVRAQGVDATAVALGDLLHLKTGVSAVDEQTVLALPHFAGTFRQLGYQVVEVQSEDWHAANVVSWGRRVLLPAHHQRVRQRLQDLGFETFEVDLSEFKKQDGGASCLSLLWSIQKPL